MSEPVMEKTNKETLERPSFTEIHCRQYVWRGSINRYQVKDVESFRLYASIILGHSLSNLEHKIEFYLLKHPDREAIVREMLSEGLDTRKETFSRYLKVCGRFSNNLQMRLKQIESDEDHQLEVDESHSNKESTVSVEASEIVKSYVMQNKAPDGHFLAKLASLGVSRDDAHRLYRLEKWKAFY